MDFIKSIFTPKMERQRSIRELEKDAKAYTQKIAIKKMLEKKFIVKKK